MNEYGSRPWRGFTPEQLLEWKQEGPKRKKKRKLGREAIKQLFEEPPKK